MTRSAASVPHPGHLWGCGINASAIIRGAFTGWSSEVQRIDAATREKKGTSTEEGTGQNSVDQKSFAPSEIILKKTEAGRILEMHTETGRDAVYGEEREREAEQERERSDTFRSWRCNGHSPVNK